MNLDTDGFAILTSSVSEAILQKLSDTLFSSHSAGERCLLDQSAVREVTKSIKSELIHFGFLPEQSVAIQAIAFNKTPATNWKVAWHQDLMFPFAKPVSSPNFTLSCTKQGVDYARPPVSVLQELLAVRLHLDGCDTTNGPLRISPGTHRSGIIRTSEIQEKIAISGEITCLAKKGEMLLMRPLTLHASSQATEPKHRRVLHLVYHSGTPIPETWHRTI